MKLLLITSVVCFAAALAAPADKQKREILPGDPRYGTDYHHHHHHHEHDNDVQISKAAGGYVGSFTVPEETEGHSLQAQPLSSYGPPNYNPGKPLGPDYVTSSNSDKNSAVQVPATSYGIPDTQINNNYVEPAVEDSQSSAIVKTDLNTDYQAPSVEAPISSYVAEHEEHPQTSYTSSAETTIQEQPQVEPVHVEKAIPEVHHEVHHVQPAVHKEIVSVPQVKSHVPVENQGAQHLSVSSLPSYTSSISSFPNYFYSSYPSYSSYSSYPSYPSYSNIPVKTVDHRVHVQVPQPYPVPVTKHVTYPVPVPHAVDVPKPYYVRVAQPVQVTVNRPYAVEVPRPVPYPVPQYVRTNIPIVQQQHIATLDATKASPFEGFIENAQSTFQNVIGNLPSLPQNPFENFLQNNPFQNFELPSFPSLPSFSPQVTQTPAPATGNNVQAATNVDSVAIDNPVLKKTAQSVVTHHHQTQSAYKPTTTCAGCSVSSTHINSKHVQPTDNGYNY